MSGFKYEGDLQGARQRQLDYISEVLEKRGYKGSKVVIEPVGKVGDNYMANVKRIVVKENGKVFKMVAKLAPESPLIREALNVSRLFQNEHFMYTVVIPRFDQKQKSAGIPENERFKFAKCYGSLSEVPNEVILLEDLKESNFDILSRFESLNHENIKLVLKNFAVYHGLSFVVRYQEPETYADYQKELAANLDWDGWNERTLQYFNLLENQIAGVVDGRCEKAVRGAMVRAAKCEAKSRKIARDSKYTVIQQGDAWTSNIMFRFENNVTECILIDYQMVRENSPVYDLMFLLFNSTTHKQRLQHFQEYIDYYHNKLDEVLNYFNLKANFVYPRDRLDADMKFFGKLMFAASIIVASMVSKKTEEAETMKEVLDFKDENDTDKAISMMLSRDKDSLNMFKGKVEDLADSFCEFGLL